VAAQRAGGVVVVEPGLQAGAVEEVAAGELVHHGLRLETAQAHPAVRAGVAPPEPRRPEPAPEPVREAGTRGGGGRGRGSDRRELVLLALLPRLRHGKAQEHQRRAHQARHDGDRHRRVVQDVGQQAVLGCRHAGEAHLRRRRWGRRSIRGSVRRIFRTLPGFGGSVDVGLDCNL
jgi:hypothetical protein